MTSASELRNNRDSTPPDFVPMAWVEGRIAPASEARVPLDDRGFYFGEAVYEVFLAIGGRVFAHDEHLARLLRSARGIGLDPERFLPRVHAAIEDLGAAAGRADALVYLQVTGGAGPRDHLPPAPGHLPGVYATIRPFDLGALRRLQERGLTAILHPDNRWPHATWKTTQLLGSVLAKRAARERGADEVLFFDRDGYLLEGGSTNVFVVRDGRVLTPPLTRNILPGITRQLLLERRPELVLESDVRIADLSAAEEIFIASTTRPVVAVTSIDGRPVGDGRPGRVTRELANCFFTLLRG